MPQQSPELQAFVNECVEEYHSGVYDENAKRSAADVAFIMTVLISQGLYIMLPEIREWLKLGVAVIALKRQELERKLQEYAREKELDYPTAEKAARIVADRLNEDNIEAVVKALEASHTD